MSYSNYRIFLRREPEGGYTVTVPALEGCITYGDDIDSAIKNAKEAIELFIETLIELKEPVPSEDGVLEYNLSIENHG